MNAIRITKDGSSAPASQVAGSHSMTHDQVVEMLTEKRRIRVIGDDRFFRRMSLGMGAVLASPWAILGPNMDQAGSTTFVGSMIVMGMAVCGFFPPLLLWASMFKGDERKRLERGTPVFVPPPAKLADGTYGPVWQVGQEDLILIWTGELVKAIDAHAPKDEIEALVADVARRAMELVGGRSIDRPSPRSSHHYWPNKEISNGSGDDRIVSYDDNLPIQGQRRKLKQILEDLRNALTWVGDGVDSRAVVTEVLDLVAALRRVVELSGHDAGPLRGKPQPVIAAPAGRSALPRHTPRCVATALADVERVLALDHEAVDGLGNRIEPLNAHALRMYEAHKEAYAIAGEDQKPTLDEQLERAMGYVSEAARQGLEIQQRRRIDKVGTELRFIATRSGDHS